MLRSSSQRCVCSMPPQWGRIRLADCGDYCYSLCTFVCCWFCLHHPGTTGFTLPTLCPGVVSHCLAATTAQSYDGDLAPEDRLLWHIVSTRRNNSPTPSYTPYQVHIAYEAEHRGPDILLHLPIEPY